jgi:hypothetical protein
MTTATEPAWRRELRETAEAAERQFRAGMAADCNACFMELVLNVSGGPARNHTCGRGTTPREG